MTEQQKQDLAEERLYRVENAAGVALRVGVGISVAVILFGMALLFARPTSPVRQLSNYHDLFADHVTYPQTVPAIIEGVKAMHGRAFVVAGIGILILTPIMRVVISLVAFAIQRDRAFVVITSIVLAILLLSLMLGRVEHG